MRTEFAIFAICCYLLQLPLFAQSNLDPIEKSRIEFKNCIDKFEQSRSSIGSYCVKIQQFSHRTFNNATDPRLKAAVDLSRTTIEIACDVVNDRLLAIRTLSPLQPGVRLPSKQVFLFIGAGSYFLNPEGKFSECIDKRTVIPIPDPLSLGAGRGAQTMRYYPLDEVTQDLHAAHEDVRAGFLVQKKGAIMTFSNLNEHISFDTSRDCVPIELFDKGDKSGTQQLQGRTKHILVSGIWLPEIVSYITNTREFLHMELDWISLNEPLPAGIFEHETLERLFKAKDANDLLNP